MAYYQYHSQLFHYVLVQEWGGATWDYKKSIYKKLNFNMARKGRSEVSDLIFSTSTPTTIKSERKTNLQKQENRVMCSHMNKE
jgi:hypothetical protein